MNPSYRNTSRLAWVATALCVFGLFTTALPAQAQSTKDRLDQSRARLTDLKSRAGRIAAAYTKTEHELDETRDQIAETESAIRRAEADMLELRKKLKARVRAAYQMRGVGFFQFLLQARSFREFSIRLMNLQQTTLKDEDLILKLRKKSHELDVKEAELGRHKRALDSQKAAWQSQARRMTISLAEQNRIYQALKGELRREELARLFRVLRGGVSGITVPLDACPVAGPHNVTNSFGAARGGGTRRHQGNDIMAPHGAPVVAVVSGRVVRTGSGGLGGLSVYLYGEGNEFYYAHLSRISVGAGQSVAAGQTLGANGSSGNASGGSPHLHFEIHPGGGRAIDPYPSLSRVC